MKYKKRTIGIVVLAVYSAHVFWPWINFYSEGDNCTFGTVSNEQYRNYLAEAEHLADTSWKAPSLNHRTGYSKDWAVEITRRIDEMTKGEESFYRTIAKTHAVIRAMNGQYFSGVWAYSTTGPDKDPDYWKKRNAANPTVQLDKLDSIARFEYGFDSISHRYLPLRPFSFGFNLGIWVGRDLTSEYSKTSIKRHPKKWTSNKFLRVNVIDEISLLDPPLISQRKRAASPVGGHCPRLPSKQWLERYFDDQAKRNPDKKQRVWKP